ncbi:MAG TPA: hypothetical protein VFV50_02940 [Bdellovibrionales bacterium]|nr:hypothetical protein [Bdellovibrionales bacterium]
MGEIFFVLKISVVTLVLVFLMQIKLGDDTLENRALFALRDSALAGELQQIGTGGWKELRKTIARLGKSLSSSFGGKEDRLSVFGFGRSEAYKEEQERKREARRAVDRATDALEESAEPAE